MTKLQLLVRTLNRKRYITTSTAFGFWNTHCKLIQTSWFFTVTEISQRISEDFQVCRKVVPCRKTFRRHYDPSISQWLFTSRYGVTYPKTWILFWFFLISE